MIKRGVLFLPAIKKIVSFHFMHYSLNYFLHVAFDFLLTFIYQSHIIYLSHLRKYHGLELFNKFTFFFLDGNLKIERMSKGWKIWIFN